jgi:streptogramin lyase
MRGSMLLSFRTFLMSWIVAVLFIKVNPIQAVTLLPGDLIVAIQNAASGYGEIDKVNPTNGQQTLIATDTTYQTMSTPYDALIGPNGMIYATDGSTRHILSINPSSGALAVVTTFPSPSFFGDLAINSQGNLLVADQGLHGVYKVNPTNGSTSLLASIPTPFGITLDHSGNILVSDLSNTIYEINGSSGNVSTVSSGNLLSLPRGLAVDSAGNIDVVDQDNDLVRVNPTTGSQSLVSSGGFLADALGLTIEPSGTILVAESSSTINPTGAILAINPNNGSQSILSSGGRFENESGVSIAPEPGSLSLVIVMSLFALRQRRKYDRAQCPAANSPASSFPLPPA